MKILLATDGSAHSQAAVDLLNRIPFPAGSEVTLLSVVELPPSFALGTKQQEVIQEVRQEIQRQAEENLAQQADCLKKAGWSVTVSLREGHVAREIISTAEDLSSELIVIGSHGRGVIGRFLLGSVSQKVAKYAPCSVLLVRKDEAANTAATEQLKILLAYDNSVISDKAAKMVQSLPLGENAAVDVITVMPIITYYGMDVVERMSESWQEEKHEALAALETVAETLKQDIPNTSAKLTESVDISQEILEQAEALNSDIIVIGQKGQSAIDYFLLGSVSSRVIHHAYCSVWIVR
ncbi:MAG: universal stress protein [Planctomycetaceae bacterium]|nr:universal stress protein [Planctomycetaceae bacterium]